MSELAAAPDRERTVTRTDPDPTLALQAAPSVPRRRRLRAAGSLHTAAKPPGLTPGRAPRPFSHHSACTSGHAQGSASATRRRPASNRGRPPDVPNRRSSPEHVGRTRPSVGAASTLASSVLNLVGYRTAVEEGRLLLDHPDGVVTFVSTIERLALPPFVLFWFAWAALRLTRDGRRWTTRSLAGLAAVLLVAVARFVVLLAVYFEHDNILADPAGDAALDLFQSSWITAFFLVVAGFAADRLAKALVNDEVAPIFVLTFAFMSREHEARGGGGNVWARRNRGVRVGIRPAWS